MGSVVAARYAGSIPAAATDGLLSRDLRRRDHDVAVVHRTVIALEQQRPGVSLGAVDRAAGDARNLPVSDHTRAVQLVGEHPADERDVHRLPLAGRPRHVLARRNEAVESTEVM